MPAEAFKSPEKMRNLDTLMAQIAQAENAKFGPVLNVDCSVNMDNFTGMNGYDVEADKKEIEVKEVEWSDANTTNENLLAYFSDIGLNTPETRLAYWKNKKEASENEKLEKVVAVLFHKILRPEFLVARASTHDDYVNGIDTIIVDSKTQKVIGAFDEVKGEEIFKRNREKKEKVLKYAKRGGAKLKYGINLEKDPQSGGQKLVKKEIRNLPLFLVSLTKEELREMLSGMNYQLEGRVSEVELKVFDQLMASFEEQVKILESEKRNIPGAVFANIQIFKESLARMKKLGGAEKIKEKLRE